jgi:hypothetical protein
MGTVAHPSWETYMSLPSLASFSTLNLWGQLHMQGGNSI